MSCSWLPTALPGYGLCFCDVRFSSTRESPARSKAGSLVSAPGVPVYLPANVNLADLTVLFAWGGKVSTGKTSLIATTANSLNELFVVTARYCDNVDRSAMYEFLFLTSFPPIDVSKFEDMDAALLLSARLHNRSRIAQRLESLRLRVRSWRTRSSGEVKLSDGTVQWSIFGNHILGVRSFRKSDSRSAVTVVGEQSSFARQVDRVIDEHARRVSLGSRVEPSHPGPTSDYDGYV